MNDKAIKKYFWDAWKSRLIIARTNDGKLWLSDVNCLIVVNETDPVLESRKIFPTIPNLGESLSEIFKDDYRKGPDVESVIGQALKADNKPLKITEWYQFYKPAYFRMFETADNQKIFINVNLLNLVSSYEEELLNYQYLTPEPEKPVLVKNKQDELIAILMPIYNAK